MLHMLTEMQMPVVMSLSPNLNVFWLCIEVLNLVHEHILPVALIVNVQTDDCSLGTHNVILPSFLVLVKVAGLYPTENIRYLNYSIDTSENRVRCNALANKLQQNFIQIRVLYNLRGNKVLEIIDKIYW